MPEFKGSFSSLDALQALTNFFRDGSVAGYQGMSNILCKLLKIFVILFHQRSQPLINKHLVTDHCPVRQTM